MFPFCTLKLILTLLLSATPPHLSFFFITVLILLLLVFFTHIPAYGMLEESNEDQKKIALDANIKNIQNICANKDTLLLLYQDEEQSSKIKKINFNQNNKVEDITFEAPTNISEYEFISDKNYIVKANYEHLFFIF